MANFEECPRFEWGCNAPLCPLDEESLKNGIFYPDEEICKNQKVNKLDWIKRQRKLARRACPDFYFTYEMLKHNFKICTGIKGLDPSKSESQEKIELKKWFEAHPEAKKREPTLKQIEARKKFSDMRKKAAVRL